MINRLLGAGEVGLKAFTKLGFSLSVYPTAVPLRDSLLNYSILQYNIYFYLGNWNIQKKVEIRIQLSLIFSVMEQLRPNCTWYLRPQCPFSCISIMLKMCMKLYQFWWEVNLALSIPSDASRRNAYCCRVKQRAPNNLANCKKVPWEEML